MAVGVTTMEQPVVPSVPVDLPEPPPDPEPIPPRTPASTGLLEMNPTIETVERMWDADVATPLDEWEPSEFAEAPRINTSAFVTAGLIIFAVFALWTATSELMARQDARLDALHQDTVALADVVASLTTDDAEERLSDVDTYARAVFDRADELDLGNPDRALAIEAAGSALDLERNLGEALAYRAAFDAVIERPSLPTAGEPEQASAAAERLVMWSTGVVDVISAAPTVEAFGEHRTAAADFEAAHEAVQTTYLDALRAGDAEAATGALIEIDASVQELEATVDPAVSAAVDVASGTAAEIRRAAGRMTAVDQD